MQPKKKKTINPGKMFEAQFKESAQEQGLLIIRFKDSDMSFNKNKELRHTSFTTTNPADFFVYEYPYIYFLELKSTKYKSISFQREEEDKSMILLHQIRDLSNLKLYEKVQSGFVFNFRTEDEGIPYSEITYYMDIEDFVRFYVATDKKSIAPIDIVQYGGFIIDAKQKRKYYSYDVNKMLKDIIKNSNKRKEEIDADEW